MAARTITLTALLAAYASRATPGITDLEVASRMDAALKAIGTQASLGAAIAIPKREAATVLAVLADGARRCPDRTFELAYILQALTVT